MKLSKALLPFISLCFFTSCTSLSTQGERARVQITKPRSTEDLYVADIEAFGKKFELTLTPLDDIWSENAKIMRFSNVNNIELHEKTKLSKRTRVYHDQTLGAVLTVDDENINGVLDSHNTITSFNGVHLAHKVDLINDRNDYVELPKNYSNVKTPTRHLVMDADPLTIPLSNFETTTVREIRKNSWNVEVAVVIDSLLSEAIGTDEDIYKYVTLFWNAVKKRFANIETPKLNIKLVGAYIIRDKEGEPFITNHLFKNQTLNPGACLSSFNRWIISDSNSLPPHDLMYLQTSRELINASGMAYVGTICKAGYSSGLGEDMGAYFGGVNIATHEVAHILGASHDGQANSGTDSCPYRDGYVIGSVLNTINTPFFSECSKAQMAENTYRSCLNSDLDETTPPNVFDSTNSLPGEVYTMNKQCQLITGKPNAYVDTSVSPQNKLCYNLICKYDEGPYTRKRTTFHAAAEGSPCPHGGKCRNWACV